MPRNDVEPGSIWRCPCGYEGLFYTVLGHRRGAKKRPDCHGEMFQVAPGPLGQPVAPPPLFEDAGMLSDASLSDGDSLRADDEEQPDVRPPWEYTGRDDLEDPEEIARRYNLNRQAAPPGDGNSRGLHPLEGDWQAEVTQGPISSAREQVILPATLRVMYDWCRGQGWFQGDGSLSSWVTDVVLDWWVHRAGMAIVVVPREEVGLSGHA